MKERTQAIILRATKFGESDLICRVLTQKGAKLSLIAKAALKSRKRFGGGVLEPTQVVEMEYSHSRKSENQLSVLSEAHLVEGFAAIRQSYDALQTAFYFLQCTEKVSQEGYESPQLYNLLGNALKALGSKKPLEECRLHFQIKLLYAQGVFRPDPWQEPFLKRSVREFIDQPVTTQQRFTVELAMENYLKTAEAEDQFFSP